MDIPAYLKENSLSYNTRSICYISFQGQAKSQSVSGIV